MIEQIPIYVSIVFILTTFLTLAFLIFAVKISLDESVKRKWTMILIITLVWLAIQAYLGLAGFYRNYPDLPPRFAFAVGPPLLFIIILFLTSSGRKFLDGLSIKTLTYLSIVRVPIELVLLWLYLGNAIPQVMTFEGRNFDIIAGLTAPLIGYFGFSRNLLNKKIILIWNVACIGLLLNIVILAVLSTPYPFQKFGFDHPNIAVFYFPYIWLPAFIVPVVLLSQLTSIRYLILDR